MDRHTGHGVPVRSAYSSCTTTVGVPAAGDTAGTMPASLLSLAALTADTAAGKNSEKHMSFAKSGLIV